MIFSGMKSIPCHCFFKYFNHLIMLKTNLDSSNHITPMNWPTPSPTPAASCPATSLLVNGRVSAAAEDGCFHRASSLQPLTCDPGGWGGLPLSGSHDGLHWDPVLCPRLQTCRTTQTGGGVVRGWALDLHSLYLWLWRGREQMVCAMT